MTRAGRATVLLESDPWAREQVEPTYTALRRWTWERFKRQPDGPPHLRVLRDWLIEQGCEIPALDLACIVRVLHRERVRPSKPRKLRMPEDPRRHPVSPYAGRGWAYSDGLDQIAACGERYRFRLSEGDVEGAKEIRAWRTIWVRRALHARRQRRESWLNELAVPT
jgi:hypothetical protein